MEHLVNVGYELKHCLFECRNTHSYELLALLSECQKTASKNPKAIPVNLN